MSRNRIYLLGLLAVVVVAVVLYMVFAQGGATPAPTATPVPPTATPVPPTATPLPPTETPIPPQEAPVEDYPAPAEEAVTPAPAAEPTDYPAPNEEATIRAADGEVSYPAPEDEDPGTSRIPIVPFVLERPLTPGATVVRGTGPVGAPIIIADVFLMGEILAETVIDANGRFEVTVPALTAGHWIGIALQDLTGTEFTYDDFMARGFRGAGAEQVPNVGFFYDSDFVR